MVWQKLWKTIWYEITNLNSIWRLNPSLPCDVFTASRNSDGHLGGPFLCRPRPPVAIKGLEVLTALVLVVICDSQNPSPLAHSLNLSFHSGSLSHDLLPVSVHQEWNSSIQAHLSTVSLSTRHGLKISFVFFFGKSLAHAHLINTGKDNKKGTFPCVGSNLIPSIPRYNILDSSWLFHFFSLGCQSQFPRRRAVNR